MTLHHQTAVDPTLDQFASLLRQFLGARDELPIPGMTQFARMSSAITGMRGLINRLTEHRDSLDAIRLHPESTAVDRRLALHEHDVLGAINRTFGFAIENSLRDYTGLMNKANKVSHDE